MKNLHQGSMGEQTEKGLTSIVLAILIPIVVPFLILLLTFIMDFSSFSRWISMIITALIVLTLTGMPCYFICRFHSLSVWYVPIFAGIAIVVIVIGLLSNYWNAGTKIILAIASILLIVTLSIWGAEKGRQSEDKKAEIPYDPWKEPLAGKNINPPHPP